MSETAEIVAPRGVGRKGVYRVTLYGRAGAKLYEAHFPPYGSFSYVCPSHWDGMLVYGFEIEWVEV